MIAISPDGKTLASGGEDGTLCLWDVGARKLTTTSRAHTQAHGLAFHPSGKTVAYAGSNNKIQIWDVGAENVVAVLEGHLQIHLRVGLKSGRPRPGVRRGRQDDSPT